MVGYYQAYKGSTQTPLIYANRKQVKAVYKGSELIYRVGFDTFTVNSGTSLQSWTVPLGVRKIHVDCVASKGKDSRFVDSQWGTATAKGGKGGRVECDISVNGGETLYITVGDVSSSSTPSYNASDIRLGGTELENRILVAGGGGGSCICNHYGNTPIKGGDGGNSSTEPYGSDGYVSASGGTEHSASKGGTLTEGGIGGFAKAPYHSRVYAGNGTFGLGGVSVADSQGHDYGCGGAGYYGGGGCATSSFASEQGTWRVAVSGAGGSSYADSSMCSNEVYTRGYQDGAGYITISFVE